MSEKKHALLSASGASRWLVCTRSARLEESLPESESLYADEGTLAHEIAEHLIKEKVYGVDMSRLINPLKLEKLYDESMMGFVEDYAIFVSDKIREAPVGAILVQERRVNFHEFVPEGFGRVDIGIIAPRELHVIDYKHGKGVPVSAYENKQMMLYAIGFILDYDMVFDIETVRMTIYQPRIDNISTYEITKDNLMRWAHEVVHPSAKLAFAGLGEFIPGDHCRFCRAKATCAEYAKQNLQLARRDFEITQISDEQLIRIYNMSDRIKNWLSGIEAHVLKEAIGGKQWPGMKLVAGRSTRKFSDESQIINQLENLSIDVNKYLNVKLKGITELSKNLPKDIFKSVVEPLLIKPPGAPTLVDKSDKRAEYDSVSAAQSDFE